MKNDRRLNSDQLGQKGQTRFGELCLDAGLIPNPSTYDRKGWDYIVNWPQALTGLYDIRPTPRSCLIQVKTVWAETSDISVTLAAIEQIAREAQPSFVVVQQVDDDLNYVALHVAHIAGDFLGRILKDLRQARVDGVQLNTIDLSFALAKWFRPLSFDGAALRSALEGAIGPSMGDYVARKQGELRDLGFGKDRYRLRTTLSAPDMEIVTDAFLGIGSIEARGMQTAEARFGIEVPLDDIPGDVAVLKFEPNARDTCSLTMETLDGSESVHFSGKMFSAPANLLPPGERKLRIATDQFDLVFRLRPGDAGKSDIKINFKFHEEKIAKAKLKAEELRSIYWLLERLPEDRLRLVIKPRKSLSPLSGELSWDKGEHDTSGAQKARALCESAAKIFTLANWPGAKVTIGDLVEAEREIMVLSEMMSSPQTLNPLSFTIARAPELGLDPMELLYVTSFKVGDHIFAYAASTKMSPEDAGDGVRWIGRDLKFRGVARVRPGAAAMRAFAERMHLATGIDRIFEHTFGDDGARF